MSMKELSSPSSGSSPFDRHRTLLLNADYKPLGFPLSALNGPDTVSAVMGERVRVVIQSDTYAHSPTREFRLPSVVALVNYVPAAGLFGLPACNLHNLYVRDRATCQYTGQALRLNSDDSTTAATIDHVVPRADWLDGGTHWTNVALASSFINNKKGRRRPEEADLRLLTKPWVPTGFDLLYLWLTEERLAALPEPWQEFLQLEPSPRVLRALDGLAQAA